MVREHADAALGELAERAPAALPVLMGTSLGGMAAPLAAERDRRSGARRCSRPARCLLVGGTADETWDGELARRVSPHVVEIDAAHHGRCVPGLASESTRVPTRSPKPSSGSSTNRGDRDLRNAITLTTGHIRDNSEKCVFRRPRDRP